MNAISPLDGALVYNTTEEALFYYDNGVWNPVGEGAHDVPPNNVFVGNNTGIGLTSGTQNAAFGFRTLETNASGSRNTAMGTFALNSVDGDNNSALGYGALRNNASGRNNSAFGYNVLTQLTDGINNSAFGLNALLESNGSRNTAIGTASFRWLIPETIIRL